MEQNALTVIARIKSGEVEALKEVLAAIGSDIESQSNSYFRKSPSTHFARWVILKDREQEVEPHLLFTSNYDGVFESYVQELVETVGPVMEQVWAKCENYFSGTSLNPEKFMKFIRQHSLESQAFFVACKGKTVKSILESSNIREKLDEILDYKDCRSKLGELYNLLPRQLQAPTTQVGEQQAKVLEELLKLFEYLVGIQRGINDPDRRVELSQEQNEQIQRSKEVEDKIVQNQMTILIAIKPQFLSRILLKFVLWRTKLRAKKSHGSLSGISTIHFARWVIINKGKISSSQKSYLLFESNYNGSWDNYISDFVVFAGRRMNLIWGNCVDFPTGGSYDIEWFKQHIRKHGFTAQVFYSAYPNLTVQNVIADLRISEATQQFFQQKQVKNFLSGSYNLPV